jgi:hypothetical protein
VFDNTKPNIILLADASEPVLMTKTFGVYKVAHELRRAGFECAVIHHLHVFEYEEIKHMLSYLISNKTLFVGFSTFFYHPCQTDQFYNSVLTDRQWSSDAVASAGPMLPHGAEFNTDLVAHIKSINPQCVTVLGGPNAVDKKHNRMFDYVVVGYADLSAVNLAQHLLDGTPLEKSYRSLWGFTVVNDAKASGFDFGDSTMCYEEHDAILPGETMQIEVSRGCIFQCAYCSFPLNGKHKLDFIRSEQRLREEFMHNYERWGVTRYMFLDDTFNDSVDKCALMQKVAESLPFKLEYWAYIRLDLVAAHPETAEMLIRSGLRAATFGIETWHKKAGATVGKGAPQDRQIATLHRLKELAGNKIMMQANFIVGLPHEPPTSVLKTFQFLTSDNNPIDSWTFIPFALENARNSNHGGDFSKIALDPEKYGYTVLGELDANKLDWKTDHFDWTSAKQLADRLNILGFRNPQLKLNGRIVFEFASLGVDHSPYINKSLLEFNSSIWNSIYQQKRHRARAYKDLLCKKLNIPTWAQSLPARMPEQLTVNTNSSKI